MNRIRLALLFVSVLCAWRTATAAEPDNSNAADASPAQVRQSVERSIGYLQSEAVRWLGERKCSTCHHVPMMLWTLAEARQRGYAIDEKIVAEVTDATLGSLEKMVAMRIVRDPAAPPDERRFANGISMGGVYLVIGASAQPSLEKPVRDSLALVARHIVDKQRDDGSWEFFGNRAPIAESQTTDAAWTILALEAQAAQPDASGATRAASEKAKAWLGQAKLPDSHQGKILSLLLDLRAGRPRDAWQARVDDLVRLQNADGGWSQTPQMPSDAYATGQTMYVLALAGPTLDRPELRRAAGFLVATQRDDGTWPMTSRPTLDGKGGGCSYLVPITYAGTAWATLGLVRLTPGSNARSGAD